MCELTFNNKQEDVASFFQRTNSLRSHENNSLHFYPDQNLKSVSHSYPIKKPYPVSISPKPISRYLTPAQGATPGDK